MSVVVTNHIEGRVTPAHAHINLNVRGLNPSATLAINEYSSALQAASHEVYRLGQSPFPVPDVVVAAPQVRAGSGQPVRQ